MPAAKHTLAYLSRERTDFTGSILLGPYVLFHLIFKQSNEVDIILIPTLQKRGSRLIEVKQPAQKVTQLVNSGT